MKIKGIIFDKDGTLFDIQRSWSEWANVFVTKFSKKHDLEITKLADAIHFDLDSSRFLRDSIFVHGSVNEVVDTIYRLFPQIPKNVIHSGLFENSSDAKQVPLTDLHKLFSSLNTITFGLVTNDSENNAVNHLKQHNLTQYFDMIIGYDSGYGSKPESGQLEAFLRKTTFLPQEVLMIGDSIYDLVAANKINMPCLGVL
ncbi:HAD family hydrolase, partial [Paracoccaceae bacterium]|nr:HAD family hydrolase [Paracoccaceae bacterium]